MDLKQMAQHLAPTHLAYIHRDDPLVETGKAPPVAISCGSNVPTRSRAISSRPGRYPSARSSGPSDCGSSDGRPQLRRPDGDPVRRATAAPPAPPSYRKKGIRVRHDADHAPSQNIVKDQRLRALGHDASPSPASHWTHKIQGSLHRIHLRDRALTGLRSGHYRPVGAGARERA